jgi:hypothetical protein
MMNDEYQIEVYDDKVVFYGKIDLDDLAHFLEFFRKKDFDIAVSGINNLILIKSASKSNDTDNQILQSDGKHWADHIAVGANTENGFIIVET